MDERIILGADFAAPNGHLSFTAAGTLSRDGFHFVCEVPPELGQVTGMRVKNGRVIAETESGTPMLVPVR